jgi:transcriptional regulator with XRE-family HTH domain
VNGGGRDIYWQLMSPRPSKTAKVRAVGASRTRANLPPGKSATVRTPTAAAKARQPVRTSAKVDSGAPAELANGAAEGGQLTRVIANHVRSRRQDIGLTVGQLAERSEISKGMLSKIENAQTSPSLTTLERLAGALDMPVTSLFRGLAEERDAVFVKAGSGPEIVRQGTRSGHTYELLGSLRGPHKRIEPLLVSLTERTEVFPLFQHPGVEMLYMLKGLMEYSYGKQHYRMEPRDTLQFEGDIPHGPTMLIKLPIQFLSITVYPSAR